MMQPRATEVTAPPPSDDSVTSVQPSPVHSAGPGIYPDPDNVAPEEINVDPSPFAQNDLRPSNEMQRTNSRLSRTARNERRASRPSVAYDIPDSYRNLDDVYGQPPIQNPDEEPIRRFSTREDEHVRRASVAQRRPSDSTGADGANRPQALVRERTWRQRFRSTAAQLDNDVPVVNTTLDEEAIAPDEESIHRVSTREDERERRRSLARQPSGTSADGPWALPPLSRERQRRQSSASAAAREARMVRRQSTATRVEYDVPDVYANLDEVAVSSPVQNPDQDTLYRHESLEDARSRDQEYIRDQRARRRESLAREQTIPEETAEEKERESFTVSRLATQLYTISYLVTFSLFGTLARLGLQALTTYPGAPVVFASVWPNFAGSLVMGFLAEDRMLFRFEWGTPTYENEIQKARESGQDEETGSSSERGGVDLAAARRSYMATKKTIPLYIGMATGFCGSFTSFSSFIRDVFLALSNDLPVPDATGIQGRNGGFSFMALLSVLLTTVALSLSGLFIGAHLAIVLEPITPSLPYLFTRKFLDRFVVIIGWGCWLGAVFLSIFPPDRDSGGGTETWRGRATFALVFAPLGCLTRFYASLYLNGRIGSFPLGTFTVNVLGTAVLGAAWDLAHVPSGGLIGCQAFQGLEDGFCGCLTTVSTWVAELAALRRGHAYIYGVASVAVSLAFLIAIMGGLRWSHGFAGLLCTH